MFINYFVTSFYFLTGQILVVYHLKKKQKKPQKQNFAIILERMAVYHCVSSMFIVPLICYVNMLAYQMNLLFYFYLR